MIRDKGVFSAHAKPPKKKSFFQHTTATTSHCTKTNEQLRFLPATTYCELAVHLFFFEKHQSCVCTTVTLSHRFKAFTPLFCANSRVRHVPPESFAEIFFDRALNRPRSPEVRKPLGYFWYFSYTRKVPKMFLSQEAPRFCKPRNSALKLQIRTNKIKSS